MTAIQRFLGDTEGSAFHEPVVIVYERELKALEQRVKGLRKLVPKKMLFDDVFMERFHRYTSHDRGCTWDDLTKGDVCTCGLQALINDYYEIKDALAAEEEAV